MSQGSGRVGRGIGTCPRHPTVRRRSAGTSFGEHQCTHATMVRCRRSSHASTVLPTRMRSVAERPASGPARLPSSTSSGRSWSMRSTRSISTRPGGSRPEGRSPRVHSCSTSASGPWRPAGATGARQSRAEASCHLWRPSRSRSQAIHCALLSSSCCDATASFHSSRPTRCSTCTDSRSRKLTRSRHWPTRSATRHSEAAPSAFAGVCTAACSARRPGRPRSSRSCRTGGGSWVRPVQLTRTGRGRKTTGVGFEWSAIGRGGTVARLARAASPWPCTHSGSGPSRGRPVKNLAAMQPPWQAS